MKWDQSVIDHYKEHQAFIDTAIVPCIRVGLGDQLQQSLTQATWVTGVAHGLEQQLQGRLMLFPIYSYTGLEPLTPLMDMLNIYTGYLLEHGFTHIVLLTLDREWESAVHVLDADLLWVDDPRSASSDFTPQDLNQFVQTVVPTLTKLWQKR